MNDFKSKGELYKVIRRKILENIYLSWENGEDYYSPDNLRELFDEVNDTI